MWCASQWRGGRSQPGWVQPPSRASSDSAERWGRGPAVAAGVGRETEAVDDGGGDAGVAEQHGDVPQQPRAAVTIERHRIDAEPVVGVPAVQDEVHLGAWWCDVVGVARQRPPARLFQRERSQRRTVGHLDVGIGGVVAGVGEEQLVGECFDGVAHDEGVVADELAAQSHEARGGGEAETVAGELCRGVEGAVVVQESGTGVEGAAPGTPFATSGRPGRARPTRGGDRPRPPGTARSGSWSPRR